MFKRITAILMLSVCLSANAVEIPVDARMDYNQGIDFYKLGMYERAIESFRSAIRTYPDYVDAYYNLACMYAKLDEKEKFNNILQQNLSQLDEKERVIVRQRVEHWLKNNATDYLTELS